MLTDRCFNILMAIHLVTLAEKPKLDLDLKDILGLSMMTLASTVFENQLFIFSLFKSIRKQKLQRCFCT